MTLPRKVLITGAAGDVGTVLVDRLADDYELVPTDADPEAPEGTTQLDIRDLDALVEAFDGVDAVVHLAGAASPEADWESVLELNIAGTRNVLEAARLAGVRRVVYASSNHAIGGYDVDGQWPVTPEMPVRPDSLYGVSKVFGEALGRFYREAHGLEFVPLRIGWSSGDWGAADSDVLRAMWLSEDDTARVVRAALEADDPSGGPYYATSDNGGRHRWDMSNTISELGYQPQDSWEQAAGQDA